MSGILQELLRHGAPRHDGGGQMPQPGLLGFVAVAMVAAKLGHALPLPWWAILAIVVLIVLL